MTIYGLFKNKQCIYVGQTSNIRQRRRDHISKFGYDIIFKTFRRCRAEAATRIEAQVIKSYKRRGQANVNKNLTATKTFSLEPAVRQRTIRRNRADAQNQYRIERKILSMKQKDSFTVDTEAERQTCLRDGETLRRYSQIDFVITTSKLPNGKFLIEAK